MMNMEDMSYEHCENRKKQTKRLFPYHFEHQKNITPCQTRSRSFLSLSDECTPSLILKIFFVMSWYGKLNTFTKVWPHTESEEKIKKHFSR